MFEETLSKDTKQVLTILGRNGVLSDDMYLAGGTALALQLGHRVSVDLDFFTNKEFNEQKFAEKMNLLPVAFRLEKLERHTILGYIGKTKFSLFFYEYPLLYDSKKFFDINIADIKDIAPMKLLAVSNRGIKRDFIDLYFIIAVEKIVTLEEVFKLYDLKFKTLPQNKLHILKGLSYFVSAEDTPMPRMLKTVKWTAVKKFFVQESKVLAKHFLNQ